MLHQSTQDRVKQYILSHGLRAGAALPAESELARVLGVSRPSLREAIRVLQTLGVIESRHGRGTFVGRFSLAPLVDGLSFSIQVIDEKAAVKCVREMLEIREILERDLISRVAATISEETVQELQILVDRMEARTALGEEFSSEDRLFHKMLYLHLGNPLSVQLAHAFWNIFDRLREELPGVVSELGSIVQHHQRIVDALNKRDPKAAADAMDAHFEGVRRRVGQSGVD